MKIVIVTDAWKPQMNGVVRTLEMTINSLKKSGHIIEVISPSDGYWTIPLPTYPDIKLAPFAKSDMKKRILASIRFFISDLAKGASFISG